METNQWIKELKVGDRFVTNSNERIFVYKVTRITNKQIVAAFKYNNEEREDKFWIENGRAVGENDSWHFTYMEQLTDSVRVDLLRQRVGSLLKRTPIVNMSAGQLERIKDALLNR